MDLLLQTVLTFQPIIYIHTYIHTYAYAHAFPLRLVMNPAYYGLLDPSPEGIESHLSQLIVSVLQELQVLIHTYIHTHTYLARFSCVSFGHSEKWMY